MSVLRLVFAVMVTGVIMKLVRPSWERKLNCHCGCCEAGEMLFVFATCNVKFPKLSMIEITTVCWPGDIGLLFSR